MIRRIILQNYMSHAHTIIEPAPGLTVLVGPNNCGKSAVVSALETLCNNATKDFMVRHGKKEARVAVETDNGHIFVWRRKGATVSYIIDGREIHRLKGNVPEDLHKILRLGRVDPGGNGEPFDIHFGTQKAPIFLLDEPESRAALFFASSSDAAILLKMQKRHCLKVKERKDEERWLKGEADGLERELTEFQPLDAIAEAISLVEGEHRDLVKSADEIQALQGRIERLQAHLLSHERQQQSYHCFVPLQAPPLQANTASLETLISELAHGESQLQIESARCRTLAKLAPPSTQADVPGLTKIIRSLADLEKECTGWSHRQTALFELQPAPGLDETNALEALYDELEFANRNHAKRNNLLEALADLAPPPMQTDVERLASLIREIGEAASAANSYSQMIVDATSSLPVLESELQSVRRQGCLPVLIVAEGKKQRLEQVRILLDDAALADSRGNYLDAVVGFGQAILSFPLELAEIESPANLRARFLHALEGLQAEVEQELRKAVKQKGAQKFPSKTPSVLFKE